MPISDDKYRFVVIIEKEIYKKFKHPAEKEKRSASNLASKLITEYIENSK